MSKQQQAPHCQSPNCYNDTKGRKFCSTCRSRKTREGYPLKHAFINLRSHAKERGIEFSLTLQGFQDGIRDTTYLVSKGRMKYDDTIDRIIPELGYADGNIQVLPLCDNIKKHYKDLRKKKIKVPYDYEQAKKDAGTPF